MPLLAYGLDIGCVVGHLHEVGPHEQTRRQHRCDADRRENGEDHFELRALGLVMRRVTGAGPELPEAVRREEIDGYEDNAADPEGYVDGEVDRAPVRGERSEVPGAREVEDQRADYEQDDNDCKSHHTETTPPNIRRTTAVAVLM